MTYSLAYNHPDGLIMVADGLSVTTRKPIQYYPVTRKIWSISDNLYLTGSGPHISEEVSDMLTERIADTSSIEQIIHHENKLLTELYPIIVDYWENVNLSHIFGGIKNNKPYFMKYDLVHDPLPKFVRLSFEVGDWISCGWNRHDPILSEYLYRGDLRETLTSLISGVQKISFKEPHCVGGKLQYLVLTTDGRVFTNTDTFPPEEQDFSTP